MRFGVLVLSCDHVVGKLKFLEFAGTGVTLAFDFLVAGNKLIVLALPSGGLFHLQPQSVIQPFYVPEVLALLSLEAVEFRTQTEILFVQLF